MSTSQTLDNLRTRGRRYIASRRATPIVRAIHRAAQFFEDAYENDEWDMNANGETPLIRRLAPARFTTVLDVGAHVGDWSIDALRAWPRARVHAFEVAPETCARLEHHLAAAGLSDRAAVNCNGLGEAECRREMYFFPEHPHLTCDIPRHAFAATPFQAQLVDGDGYLARHGIAHVDFVKIDVEGAEHLVLRGFRQSLEAGRIACMQFEYGAFALQTRVLLTDYYAMLQDRYWIGKIYPRRVEFADYHWTMESLRFANYLCVSRARPDLRALAESSTAAVAVPAARPMAHSLLNGR